MTTDLRIPPQNLKAERCLLGSQIVDARQVDEIRDIVSPRDFYADTNAAVQKAILKLRDSGSAVDPVTVAAQLDSTGELDDVGGVPYVLELMETVPHARNAVHYAKLVAECSRRRQAIVIAQRLIEQAHDQSADESEVIEAAESAATKLADVKDVSEIVTLKDSVLSVIEMFNQGVQPTQRVLIPEIDELIGGSAPGEMIIIAARPSHGKTMVALQCLDCAAAHQWAGLIISEEMSAMSLGNRFLSSATIIAKDQWMADPARVRFDAKEHFEGKASVYIAEKCATAAGAERAIANAVRRYGIKIVAVDYAQLLRGSGDNEQERIADVSQRMKAAAVRHNVVVLLLAQLNRGIETRDDRTPTLADLRGSGSLEQDADVVLFPLWPWKFDDTYEDKEEYRIYQAKNRNRGVAAAVITLRINAARQRLEPPRRDDPTRYAEDWR